MTDTTAIGSARTFQGKDDDWYLKLIAPNGETIMISEGHKNALDVRNLWHKYFSNFSPLIVEVEEAVIE